MPAAPGWPLTVLDLCARVWRVRAAVPGWATLARLRAAAPLSPCNVLLSSSSPLFPLIILPLFV